MWSLYENERFLAPLVFSTGKNQHDVVEEVVREIRKGTKVIFIRGACGTGKSAIALNVAKELGRTSIVVPGKTLQAQYKTDYEGKKYVRKSDGTQLSLSVITGRNNHECQFLKDNLKAIPRIKKEVNVKLHDIFEGKHDEVAQSIKEDRSADNHELPCKIELRERNWQKIKHYLIKNKLIDSSKLTQIKDVKRASVASLCPYWSPVFKADYEFKGPIFKNAKKRPYRGLNNTDFIFYERKRGCPYYEQFNAFLDADVLVFNSLKYLLETTMNRKPLTEVEIIDECDEFLDSFANKKTLNLDRLQNSLLQEIQKSELFDDDMKEFFAIIEHVRANRRLLQAADTDIIIPLKETGIYDLLHMLHTKPGMFDEFDDESYLFHVKDVAETFKDLMEETYVGVTQKEKNLVFDLVAVNLAKQFQELISKNKAIVLMSGTLHSPEVLKNIFGLSSFFVLDAEPKGQGTLSVKKTGKEKDWKYANTTKKGYEREAYLQTLNSCVQRAAKPCVVHVHAFHDLPTLIEKDQWNLSALLSREELRDEQQQDKTGAIVRSFKEGNRDVLFSTRVSRGVDFPGEECRSIVFTKYPNPHVREAFWRILHKTKPEHYWAFYKDKAQRELLQKVYRGLRSKDDHIEVWSPDTRVLEFFEEFNDLKKNG